jgi:hypothetical protein
MARPIRRARSIWCWTTSGSSGQAYRETDPTQADRQTVVANLLSGQCERPLRIVAFNTAEGWARDVTAGIAQEVLARADHDLSPAVRDFVERTA